ncbi:MAG: TonB-dependent receptor plug domain-containing protein, partial [Rikenellaceae bacterium]
MLFLVFFSMELTPSYSKEAVVTPNSVVQIIKEKRITINLTNKTLVEILKQIQSLTQIGYGFSGNIDVQKTGIFSVNMKNETVENILNAVLKGSKYTYSIIDNKIVIELKKQSTTTSQQTTQQSTKVEINGKVVSSETKKPIAGATIIITGTTDGAITDDKGEFKVSAKTGAVLDISFLGMKSVNYTVTKAESSLMIYLKEDALAVEDVVVTGIFTRSKELATGSSITVTGKELKMVGNQNILQSLRTLDPSFKIVENNVTGSDPNSLPDIELRGANGIPDLDATYKGNPNQPLFILDGFEASLQKIIDLDPNRVESISILKDASAAALYGSRSANGVIVIETKAPELGRLRLSYTGDFAVVMPDLTDYDLLNAAEKLELQLDAGHFNGSNFNNDTQFKEFYSRTLRNVKEGVDTYWMSKPLRTVFENRHNFNLTGGDNVLRYGLNFSARMTPGVMKGSNRDNFQGGVFLQYRKGGFIFKNDLQITYNEANNS